MRQLAWMLVLTLAFPALLRADEEITQYRLRPFEGSTPPEWVTPFDAAKTVLPPLIKVERGTPDDAFQQFWYLNFDGTRRYVCTDTVAANDLSGDFSVSAWINLTSASGVQTICSTIDAASSSGFRLFVRSGVVTGDAWFNETSGKRLVSVSSTTAISTSRWYRITLQRLKDSVAGDHYLELWIDSTRVRRVFLPMTSEIDNSTLDPIFGAERVTGGYGDYLRAFVHAIQVDDYALSEFWLNSPMVRDGSRYFGLPSYHDYIGEGSGSRPLERRVMDTYSNPTLESFRAGLRGRLILPFANDDYIPQGICGDQERGRLFVSLYYKDADGNNPGNYPSIVAEIEASSSRLLNVFLLQTLTGQPMTSHVGGIIYEDGLLIVPDATQLFVYDISNVAASAFDPATLTGFAPLPLRAVQVLSAASDTGLPLVTWDSIAFIDLARDENHVPWMVLGDYDASAPSRNALYRLGRFQNSRGISLTDRRLHSQLSDNMQGAATYYFANGVMRMFQAATGGSTSRILDALYPAFDSVDSVLANGVPLSVPRGLEQLTFLNGDLWTQSESGSRHLQKRPASQAPWPQCFPFIYSLDVSARLDTNVNRLPDQWEAARNVPPLVNPSLDLDGDGLNTSQEYHADTDPNDPSDFPRISIARPGTQISFPSSVLRFYTLQSSTDLRTWATHQNYRHRRGNDGTQTITISPTTATFFRILIESQ